MDDDIEYFTLPAGTEVYHGTRSEFDEEIESLESPFWVSDSPTVAEEFVTWNEGDGKPRVIVYKTTRPMKLILINDRNDMFPLEELYGINIYNTRDMADGVCSIGADGWIIPYNYPTGADIMLCRFDLRYEGTEEID